MKKFTFSLEKVLNVKQQMLDVKKNEILQLQHKVKEIEEEEENIKLEFQEYDKQMRTELENGTSPQKIMTYKNYFNSLMRREKELAKQKQQVKLIIEEKQSELVALKSEISGLEKLEENQRGEYEKLLKKSQERDIEEYVNQKSAAQ